MDDMNNYYVFKYVVDAVTGKPTMHEGEIQAFVKATDPWDALEQANCDDTDAYGANVIDKPEHFVDAIAKERKHLRKVAKQLKVMTDEIADAKKEFEENRPCPNGCGKLDENYACDKCGFGTDKQGR